MAERVETHRAEWSVEVRAAALPPPTPAPAKIPWWLMAVIVGVIIVIGIIIARARRR